MSRIPWRNPNPPAQGGFSDESEKAPIRVFNAWNQRHLTQDRQEWGDADREREEHLLARWGRFFDGVYDLGQPDDDDADAVTSFEALCSAELGGDAGSAEARAAYDRCGFYAVHVAAALGLADVVALLLARGHSAEAESVADREIGLWDEVSEVMTSGVRPLHVAAKCGGERVVALLLDCGGADVAATARTCQGELERTVTAIQVAAAAGQLAAAAALLERGADVTADGCYGDAVTCGGPRFARLLMERGRRVDEGAAARMLMNVGNSVWRGRPRADVVAAVEDALQLMADLGAKPSRTALSVFLRNGSIARNAMTEIVLLLVLYGANIANENGSLMVAAFQGKVELVKLMFELGWNAGGSVASLLNRGTGNRAGHGLAQDTLLVERLPHVALRSRQRMERASELLAEASAAVPSLQVWCRWAVLAAVQDPRKVDELPIAPAMKSFILLLRERHELLEQSGGS